ncbi:MAG: PQQ-binding-like beta-propeller repeat protein [Phycisphaerae bacterium]|nr:PQQ-binding-like beta-propeller repeat protein [Phycisphaerae bacterium]
MNNMRFRRGLAGFGAAVVAAISTSALGADWTSWRGPDQCGLVRENAVVKNWSPSGENLLWKSNEGGRTTPLVMGGRVFFIAPVGDGDCLQERVICLDGSTGKTIWDFHFNVFFSDIVAQRVGWTALAGDAETGNVYAHGTGGEFICFSRDGKVLWKHSMTEEFNRIAGYGGRLHTPVVDEDRVVISFLNTNWGGHARPAHRYVAFDKHTGAVKWWSEIPGIGKDTTYACPVVATIAGRRQLICPAADGAVYGLESRTGKIIWSFLLSKMGLNSSPVVSGNHVIVSHSEENIDSTVMGRLVCIDATGTGDITATGEVWRSEGVDAGYASPALANGRVYIVDNSANLHCVDAETGKPLWKFKLGRVGKGSATVTADGVIYVGEQNGVFWILKDAGDHCEKLSEQAFEGPNHTIDELYGSPAVVDGRVYFMTRYGSYCLAIKDAKVQRVSAADPAQEMSVRADAKPATVLIEPGDVTIGPGGTIQFMVKLFTDHGAAIDGASTKVEWTIAGIQGEMTPSGAFTAATGVQYSTGLINAHVAGLTASARVRIAPVLPIEEDFETLALGSTPAGWIGAMGKTSIVERDGSKVLQKLAEKGKPSPVWKMRAYIGQPLEAGYTVEADVLGSLARKRFKPDMGIINDRYELILLGAQKELELSRWRDEPTHGKRLRIPFEFKPDVWYRMKLRVDVTNGKSAVQGKVWPREDAEPKDWTIRFDDECPNLEGCPGLFVYSNGTTDKSNGPEVFFDNLKVTRN